jgi:uncharacterized membrane protein YoaK (UPF0700 family)
VLNYERSAELINFGAFLAFMGVNAAVIRHSMHGGFREPGHRVLSGLILPACGFLFCFSIWLNLSRPAKVIGFLWFTAGFVYDLVQTRRGGSASIPLEP